MPPKKITKKPWTKNHIDKFNWLFKFFKETHPEAEQNNFIDLNKRDLMSIIEKNPN